MRYRLQRHDGTDCSATMVPITVLRMVPIQRYRHLHKHLITQSRQLIIFSLFAQVVFDYILNRFISFCTPSKK